VKIILRREPRQPDHRCTLGLLFVGDLSLVTIERPWVPTPKGKGGTKGISCVPLGTYRLERHNSDAHPMTWALVNHELDVAHWEGQDPDPHVRTTVLIHAANWASELRGCIAPGTRTATSAQGYMVQESRKAMELLRKAVPWTDEHTLEITE